MGEWKEVTIDELFTVQNGYAFKSSDYVEENDKCLEVLKMGHIERGGGLRKAPKKSYIPRSEYLNRWVLDKGDVVMAMTDMKDNVVILGVPAIIDKDNHYVLNQRVARLKLKRKDIADISFLYNYLKWKEFLFELQSKANSGVQVNLSTTAIKESIISLPPLPEQKAIASVLSSLDDKIDLLHRQNKTLEAMAETLFRQWFVEEAQEDWGEGELGDYINVKHGYAFKGKFITTEKNNQILVTPGNFKIGGGFKVGKMKYYNGSNYPEDYIFSSDDLIVTMTDLSKDGDTLGFSALIPEHNNNEVLYLHNQRVGRVELKKDISKYFFYCLMKTDDYQWFILGGASGTSIMHTSPTSICSYSFQVPPMKRIKEFDAVVNKLISRVHKNQKQIHTLEKLRDTLLPKLMSGEVRIGYSGASHVA